MTQPTIDLERKLSAAIQARVEEGLRYSAEFMRAESLQKQLAIAESRLAEFEQEPSAWIDPHGLSQLKEGFCRTVFGGETAKNCVPLYARKAKGASNESN